jgi:hypothetical protein
MTPLETAILRTVLYADVFRFPLTAEEIHHFLIHDEPVTYAHIEYTLQHSDSLRRALIRHRGYVIRAGRADLIDERQQRDAASERLWPLALRYGRWLGRLPFVRMVALTGALAMRNAAAETDDLDYLLVTAPDRVWLARAFAILLVRLVKLRGVVICPNYVLAENTMEQEQKDLFIAHEIAQMIPLYGHAHYWQFRQINHWASDHLPNADAPFYLTHDCPDSRAWRLVKFLMEKLLGGRVGDRLERWEYRRKLARFAAEMQNSPHTAAQLDESRVKGHFNDYGHPVLRQYRQRLREYGLEEMPLAAPGD